MRRSFLIVEHNTEGQFLLSKTLKRKFPEADVVSCHEASDAVARLQAAPCDAIVVHRAADADGAATIRQLLAVRPGTLIVMVSGYDRAQEALAAGATVFLPYDEWLLLGTRVAEEIRKREKKTRA
jgi:ActR/RegA family two-component response regulator